MFHAFTFVIFSCLLLLPSSSSAQNPKGFLTFGNCTIGFLYPEEWKDFITDYSKCQGGDPNRFEDSLTEITFPQPSLSEKITPRVTIIVEPCCEFITSQDEEGYSAIMKNMTLNEYVNQTLSNLNSRLTIINSGPISLDGNEAYKIVGGLDGSDPAAVILYSINGTKLYKINYSADPSDYDTYLPGVQKIVDSFNMFVS